MGKYFKDVNTLEELRRQYKELLKKYHPDNADGSTEAAQEINSEYDQLFKVLKNRHESNATDNNESNATSAYSTNMYDWENDKALREVLQKIINLDRIEIEIVGQWIWISGNTYIYKKELKECGFKWASQKKQWYFHTDAYRKKSRKSLSIADTLHTYARLAVIQQDTVAVIVIIALMYKATRRPVLWVVHSRYLIFHGLSPFPVLAHALKSAQCCP